MSMLEETVTIVRRCPKCHKDMLEVHLSRELNQHGRTWKVEHCTNPDCDYYSVGFEDD